ncbi:MAG: leucyl aminopeptidase [Methylohalobius sp.]|nr:leucyl aminopeptidase [Methylohalobius sp.]
MNFVIHSGSLDKKRSDCLIIGVYERQKLSPSAKEIDQASDGFLTKLLKREHFKAKEGDTLLLHQLPGCRADRVLVVGLGDALELSAKQYCKILGSAVKAVTATPSQKIVCALLETQVATYDERWRARQIALAFADGCYRFTALKSEPQEVPALAQVELHPQEGAQKAAIEQGAREGKAIAEGMKLAKDLANLPGNICTPSYLAEQALKLTERYPKLKVTVLEEADMSKLGMGAILAVSRGSRQPPKLIVLEYPGGKTKESPIALVGKGLTFDAGGISLKRAENMDEMKYDMCGGATVIGTLQAVAELGLPLNLVGVIPACENLPDGNAVKPGDVVKTMAGKTVEILNTDAEGRLILGDALTYTQRFAPKAVIDIATLTGACLIALGRHATGLLANDDELANALLKAGEISQDRAWRLPLWEEYQEQLKSNFADFANVGGREGGAITAAAFLSRFADKFSWAHLDIAGTAWTSGRDKGATGRPIPLLVQFLLDQVAG